MTLIPSTDPPGAKRVVRMQGTHSWAMVDILQGDAMEVLRGLPSESVHCCVTSPPYWGLRDYGVPGQLGLEKTPEEYVEKMVAVFREVRRVLRGDGTAWVNMGDSYDGGGNCRGVHSEDTLTSKQASNRGARGLSQQLGAAGKDFGLEPKQLCGIPWRLAFALQADGWWLRQDIIWHKPNPMPESVTDRCTKSHEYLFLLSKAEHYFFDAEAIKEPASTEPHNSGYVNGAEYAVGPMDRGGHSQREDPERVWAQDGRRNRRSVWTINSEPYPEAHFATYPTALVKPCILAGTSARGCCPECGGPWERVVEKTGGTIGKGSWVNHANDAEQGLGQRTGSRLNGEDDDGSYKVKTVGWRPTCSCFVVNDHIAEDENGNVSPLQPIPCTVLDPFAGSFTTCAVAIELGRRAIGIELNAQYIELGRARCNITPGLQLA